jgi:hypothetical protein
MREICESVSRAGKRPSQIDWHSDSANTATIPCQYAANSLFDFNQGKFLRLRTRVYDLEL